MDDIGPCPDLATANPADVLAWLSKKNGRELPEEWVSMMREYCAQPTDLPGQQTITVRLP
jgi:hypothetical protein